MSATANNISAEGVKLLYDYVIDRLIAASEVEPSKNILPFFNPILKNEVPDGYTKNNKQKYKYCSQNSL